MSARSFRRAREREVERNAERERRLTARSLKAADGKKDRVKCGGGKDTAKVDAEDKVSGNCETLDVKGG